MRRRRVRVMVMSIQRQVLWEKCVIHAEPCVVGVFGSMTWHKRRVAKSAKLDSQDVGALMQKAESSILRCQVCRSLRCYLGTEENCDNVWCEDCSDYTTDSPRLSRRHLD